MASVCLERHRDSEAENTMNKICREWEQVARFGFSGKGLKAKTRKKMVLLLCQEVENS